MIRFVIFVCFVVLLFGCTVDSKRIEWANHVCDSNHGVSEIRLSGYFFTVVTCKNGAMFEGYDFD